MLYVPSVPLPRVPVVILPVLVGTTTASRNALRLASPDARMLHDDDDDDSSPMQYTRDICTYAGKYVPVSTCALLLMRTHTRPHLALRARARTQGARM